LEVLCHTARELGASEALVISARDIVLDERVLLKCMVPMCANYGVNLTCPPNSISFDDFKQILGKYRSAILLKISDISDSKPEEMKGQNSLSEIWNNATIGSTDYLRALRQGQEKLYNIIERIESLCLQKGYNFAAGLSAGGCSLCDECVGKSSGLPCRHPFKARPSMEGLGIDVMATTSKAGMQLEFNQGASSWVGLILVD
jgi:predicted metal-binding protein